MADLEKLGITHITEDGRWGINPTERSMALNGNLGLARAYELIYTSTTFFRSLGNAPITLYVDTPKLGYQIQHRLSDTQPHVYVENMWKLLNDRLVTPVRGILVGEAGEMAFWIYQACATRMTYSRGTLQYQAFRIPEPRVDKVSEAGLMDHYKYLKSLHDLTRKLLFKRLGLDEAMSKVDEQRKFEIEKVLERESLLNAREAIRLGLADLMITPEEKIPNKK